MPAAVDVRVVRSFHAPPEVVFDAWLDTDMIGRFMFGPALRDEEIVRLSVDARVGGRFSFVVRRQGTEIDHVGAFREIDRPTRLVFTWGVAGQSAEESVVTIDVAPRPNDCELELTHSMDAKWVEYAERTAAGWTKMLAALAAAVE